MKDTVSTRYVLSTGAVAIIAGAVLAVVLFDGAPTKASDDDYFQPVQDEIVKSECSECHMAFPPGMLPARSWQKIVAGLEDHFGENASLAPVTTRHITEYLVANAADAGGNSSGVLRGLDEADTPVRISEMPWWVREHREEIRDGAFQDPRVGSKAACTACHVGAEQGVFEDD
ncbi:MAG: cytochrome C [Alphaproteobacteria bacterium]|jgi:hypothetical protein|nr:cytochrome C [Alphaproteobacteria bacterium]MBT4709925.1 cytochrome C [Alphaproteobacteria bacterium]MBT5860178.1 cytochrome C [Alphaproteobacteria bacterium]